MEADPSIFPQLELFPRMARIGSFLLSCVSLPKTSEIPVTGASAMLDEALFIEDLSGMCPSEVDGWE